MTRNNLVRIIEPEDFKIPEGFGLVFKNNGRYSHKQFKSGDFVRLLVKIPRRFGVYLVEGKIIGVDFDIFFNRGYITLNESERKRHELDLSSRTIFCNDIYSAYIKQ